MHKHIFSIALTHEELDNLCWLAKQWNPSIDKEYTIDQSIRELLGNLASGDSLYVPRPHFKNNHLAIYNAQHLKVINHE